MKFFAVLLFALVTVGGLVSAAALPADLTGANIDTTLNEKPPDSWALVEFYASWCGTCQMYKPIYEEVAQILSQSPQATDVFVARADCATETALCNRMKVHGYPTMLFGHPGDFVTGATTEPVKYENGLTGPDTVIDFVAETLGRSIFNQLQPEAATNAGHLHMDKRRQPDTSPRQLASDEGVDLTDVVTATIAAFRNTVDNPALMQGVDSRQALKDFFDLLATAHPAKQCREGAEAAEAKLAKVWPDASKPPPPNAFAKTNICGRKLVEQDWGSCKGSSSDTRGYTCGLWQLFHTLAAQVTGDTGGALWMAAVKGFMTNFFPCDDCSRHFGGMASEDDALTVRTPNEALLWSWRAHNRVNERVAKDEEKNGFGDPAFPKMQWPSSAQCPACHSGGSDGSWNEGEVLKYLRQYYGNTGSIMQSGRTQIQMHRKAAWARSQHNQGHMFHGVFHRTLGVAFWLFVVAGVLTILYRSLPPSSGKGGGWGHGTWASNGKLRHI